MSEKEISRPLSPHLQIYRLTMTMAMSVAHRLSGLVLYGAMFGFVAWLCLLAFAPTYFNEVQLFFGSTFGRVLLFFCLWAFCHHLCGGVRHFFWDGAMGLGALARQVLAWATLLGGLSLALIIYFAPYYEDFLGKTILGQAG